ncbi:MAG: protein translocase subunit SecF [Methanobrevibacter sp.]|jgi:preprotein translocase subunit SecF|nr:protein translocase subunit SecF [Candidatus Methanovirga aequatorialis]
MIEKMMKNYKLLIVIPVIVTIIMLGVILTNGLEQGVELKGGSIANLELTKNMSSTELKNTLSNKLNSSSVDVLSKVDSKVSVEIGNEVNETVFTDVVGDTGKIISYSSIGPVLSAEAMVQIYWAIAFAFIFMSITVFIIFREFVPSIAIILAAVSDIVVAIGGMSIFHIDLSIASVGAILMLIGYSVDSDILLTTRLLRRKEGTVSQRALNAMKTGITMSFAAIVAMAVLYIVTIVLIPEASTLSDIAIVLIFGLLGDITATWLMNLGIIRWYLGDKGADNL